VKASTTDKHIDKEILKMGTEIKGEKVLYSAADCARLCGVSRRTWFRLSSSLRTPACIRVGASPRWVRKTLELWISMSCPSRQEFEARRKGGEMLSAEKRAAGTAPRTTQRGQVYQGCQFASSRIDLLLAGLLFCTKNPGYTPGERLMVWDRFDRLLRLRIDLRRNNARQ